MKNNLHFEAVKDKVLGNFHIAEQDLSKWESDPYYMDNSTVIRFWDIIEKAPAVRIVGDYDVDGIMSSYILAKSIMSVCKNKPVKVRIPRRFSEGYGINRAIFDEILEKDPKGTLVITVDNGIACPELFEELESKGYPVIVTDHHQPGEHRLANVQMVLDPQIPGQEEIFNGNYWCGAGVALKLCEQYLDEETAKRMEVFAGVATIADVMDLKEGNWGLVKRMMNAFREERAPEQLSCLISMLKQDPKFVNEETFSYYLCPALNAPGRLYDTGASQVLSYLVSPTVEKAKWLISVNENRKELRDTQTSRVVEEIFTQGLENDCPIWVSVPQLHEGIIGIIAADVAQKFGVPTIVLTEKEDGTLKGSARSYGGINLFDYLNHCGAEFIKMGGHAEAAGMSILPSEMEKARLCQIPKPQPNTEIVNSIYIDQQEIPDLYQESRIFEPFGKGNPKPVFSTLIDAKKDKVKMVGVEKNHMIVEGTTDSGAYKIMHFHHEPNELKNKEKFLLYGTLTNSVFDGQETPALDGDIAADYDEQEHENDYEKEQ